MCNTNEMQNAFRGLVLLADAGGMDVFWQDYDPSGKLVLDIVKTRNGDEEIWYRERDTIANGETADDLLDRLSARLLARLPDDPFNERYAPLRDGDEEEENTEKDL